MDETQQVMIITNSFNGLLNRLAGLDYVEVLKTARKILKQAKRAKIEPTMRMSEVHVLTGLTKQDFNFFASLRLVQIVEPGDDPLLSVQDVHGLAKVFSRFVREGVIC